MVRNATALSAAGHHVTVVTPAFEPSMTAIDELVAQTAEWNYRPVDLLGARAKLGLMDRVFKRIWNFLLRRRPIAQIGHLALVYGAHSLKRVLQELDADLIVAQQQAVLPLVAEVALQKGIPYACDIEDVLTESTSEPTRLLKSIESRYLPGARIVATMSEAASDFIASAYPGVHPLVLHNCPSLAERGLAGWRPGQLDSEPSIYWFGQTLGPHSLALELIEANAIAGHPFRLAFRGRPEVGFVLEMKKLAESLGGSRLLEILPPEDPSRMVIEAQKHDVLFGSQPAGQLFHELAVGNKVFTGLMAGAALLVSDTRAHRQLARELGISMTLADTTSPASLARALKILADDRPRLEERRKAAWELSSNTFNWEHVSALWTAAVDQLIMTSHA